MDEYEELIITDIRETENENIINLTITKELSTEDKLYNLSVLFKGYPNPFYRNRRVAFMTIDQAYIYKHNVRVGDDISKYDDIKYKLYVMESTDKKHFEDEGVPHSIKINPSTNEPVTILNKPVYHATFLVPADS